MQAIRNLVCVEGRGRISWSGLTQDITMGSRVFQCGVELAWRRGCVMDCHTMAQGSIRGGNGIKTELHVFSGK